MTFSDALALGRVSNLPTVWTNTLAGMALAGGLEFTGVTAWLILAMSLFYAGGMYLNDFFDAEIDAVERPERPIPSGRVGRLTVASAGFAMLAGGAAVVLIASTQAHGGFTPWPIVAALALGGAIFFYDVYHKTNPLSPVIMGLCRFLVYVTAGLCVAIALPGLVLVGASLLLCYLIGLTYVAKQENLGSVENLWPLVFLAAPVGYGVMLALDDLTAGIFLALFVVWMAIALWFVKRRGPGDIPRAVVSLIAGISLLDAMLIYGAGSLALACVAVAGFAVTLLLQRFVPGT